MFAEFFFRPQEKVFSNNCLPTSTQNFPRIPKITLIKSSGEPKHAKKQLSGLKILSDVFFLNSDIEETTLSLGLSGFVSARRLRFLDFVLTVRSR